MTRTCSSHSALVLKVTGLRAAHSATGQGIRLGGGGLAGGASLRVGAGGGELGALKAGAVMRDGREGGALEAAAGTMGGGVGR